MYTSHHLPWGKAHRLVRLKSANKFFFIIALDHGLSLGPIMEISKWVTFAERHGIPAAVVNPGALQQIPPESRISVVLQTFGLPGPGSKIPICTIDNALYSAADAISVQMNVDDFTSPTLLEKVCNVISQATTASLPVLCMINVPASHQFTAEAYCKILRACTEMGVDIVKLPLPWESLSTENRQIIAATISTSAPVVFPGGAVSDRFHTELSKAVEVGYSGVCVGRQIFNSAEAVAVVNGIKNLFS